MPPSTSTAPLVARSITAASRGPVASSSRVQLRSLHSTQVTYDEGRPSQSASSGWQGLAGVVRRSQQEGQGGASSSSGGGSIGQRPGSSRWGASGAGAGAGAGAGLTGGMGGGDVAGRSFAVPTPSSGAADARTPFQSMPRLSKPVSGQMISPHGLMYESLAEHKPPPARPLLGPTKREAIQTDQIHRLGLNPGKPSLHDDSYKNGALLAVYCTELGKIKPRRETRLTIKSQRKVAKAIRRAKSMGLLPHMANTQGWNNDS